MKRIRIGSYILSVLFVLIFSCSVLAVEKFGTYIKVIKKAEGSFESISSGVESELKKAGWNILAIYDNGVPDGCKFRSRVIVFSSPDYASSIIKNGIRAAFALPLRASIYEDETGINIAVLNPASINRTIIDEKRLDTFSQSVSDSLVKIIETAVNGTVVLEQIGQLRKKGRIGGMGGGNFADKIEIIFSTDNASNEGVSKVAEQVQKSIAGNNKGWKLIYTYDLSAYGVVILGITKMSMESKAFAIAGEKRESSSYKFPGIDHGAAFPIEVIIYNNKGKTEVVTLDEMYRMKLYFQDAGMWAFMKNMTMPGRIEKEIVNISRPVFSTNK